MKIGLGIILIASLMLSALIILPKRSGAQYPYPYYDVKLFSAQASLLGEWKAKSGGHKDGIDFVFSIDNNGKELEVRICGTYSAEELPRQ
ncbi:MAG TPA: hypothetical protein VIS48_13490 [Candidatus Kryptonia bacterium]